MFLADLWRFHNMRSKGDPALGEAARAAFLETNIARGRPTWAKDVDWFVAGALLERLDRLAQKDEAKLEKRIDLILAEIERALGRASPAG
jgi:hypothetical protein